MTQTLSFSLEIKALNDREFSGHGSIFGNVDLGGDAVMPGAFKRTLARHKTAGTLPSMFWMHSPNQVPGVWKEMREDEQGLFVKGELADTQLGNEMRTLLGMKAVRGLSIGYRTIDREWTDDGVRLLKEVDLMEVSIVSLAMNPLAKIEASKARLSELCEYVPTEREFEKSLRDAGYSRSVACHLASKVFDGETDSGMLRRSIQRDAGLIESEDEAAQVLKSINALTDKFGAAAISRK